MGWRLSVDRDEWKNRLPGSEIRLPFLLLRSNEIRVFALLWVPVYKRLKLQESDPPYALRRRLLSYFTTSLSSEMPLILKYKLIVVWRLVLSQMKPLCIAYSVVAHSLRRTRDREVAGLSLSQIPLHSSLEQVIYTHVPLSPSSMRWYQPNGGK